MFYNRDYVCNRRYDIDQDNKQFTIINESIEHPLCPEKPPIHRVKEYWSHIVIRSTSNSLDEVCFISNIFLIFRKLLYTT